MTKLYTVIYQFRINNYTVLKLDKDLPLKDYNKYLIDDIEHEIIPVYDMDSCIAIEYKRNFIGKKVSFI